MPTKTVWVKPELFLKYKKVRVWHMYKDDDWDQGPRTYDFTLKVGCEEMGSQISCHNSGDPCRHVFDVRDLPNWTEPPHPPFMTGPGFDKLTKRQKAALDRQWKKYHDNEVEKKHIREKLCDAVDLGFLNQDGYKTKSEAVGDGDVIERPQTGD